MKPSLSEIESSILTDINDTYPTSTQKLGRAAAGAIFALYCHADAKFQKIKRISYIPPDQGGTISDLIRWVPTAGRVIRKDSQGKPVLKENGDHEYDYNVQSVFVHPCSHGSGSVRIIVIPKRDYAGNRWKEVDLDGIQQMLESRIAPASIDVVSFGKGLHEQKIDFQILLKNNSEDVRERTTKALQMLFESEAEPWLGGHTTDAKNHIFNKRLKYTKGEFDIAKVYDALISVDTETPSVKNPRTNAVQLEDWHHPVLGEITFGTK